MIRGMDALQLAIDAAGGVGKLADSLGVRQSVVSNWKARGRVPAARCPYIEAATTVPCERLRPDLEWHRDDQGRITGYHVRTGEGS